MLTFFRNITYRLLGKPVATEWEHGFKTHNVTATRYKKDVIGPCVGFAFPNHPYDCDRSELCDFMLSNNGDVVQCGGYPSTVMFVRFQDVTNIADMNAKMVKILPTLDRLIRDVGDHKAINPDNYKIR